jgi:glycerophosphoryl diester phosphodiesterase
MADQAVVSATDEVLARVRELSAGKIRAVRPLAPDQDANAWLALGIAGKASDVALVPPDAAIPETCETLHAKQVCLVGDACGPHDNPAGWNRLLAAHVDMVRTDRPEEFLAHAISLRTANRTVQYAAHRGALRYAPENTTASLEAAANLHADFVEIDVHTTSDGGFFLLHDGTLDRTTNGSGRVRQSTNEVMRGLDAGSWFGLPFAGAAVPELDGYLARFPSSMGLYFDAKDITPEALAAAVAKHNLVERTVVYQGPVYLEKLKQINPAIRTLAPVAAASHVDTLAKRFKPYAVDTAWKLLSPEYIKHCHELDIKVFSDAKGDTTIEQYRQAIEWGIDLIQTDHPLRLWRAIDQLNAK